MSNEMFTALFTVLRARAERVRKLHRASERDLGALSIELALLVAALVVIAGIVIAIVTTKAQEKAGQIG